MVEEIFIQISLVILLVLGVSLVMRILKQPLIIGYILSGIIIGPFFLNMMPKTDTLATFSQFGIAFLLFIVGLHLSPKVIKEVGKASLITGIGQIVFTSLVGFLIAFLFGFSPLVSAYIAVALTFSSTIIIMKLLSDKNDLETLYGKISIGFLLVQDLIAILILIVISSFSNGQNFISGIGLTLLKGAGLVAIIAPISIFVLPRLQKFFAKSQEFLFIFSIAWGLGLAALFFYAGLSIEVGALIAGILLSVSPYNFEISSKLKPLRDFFIISFFLLLGSQMIIGDISSIILPVIAFSIFILIGNPLIVMILMGLMGYTKRTGFLAGLTVAQISEFSLILIALGVKVGHLSPEILSLVTMVGLITIAGSTYLILYSEEIYSKISKYLSIFERKNVQKDQIKDKESEVILFGYNRIGFGILRSLKDIKKKYLVVDFNPDTVSKLSKMGIPSLYGDVCDDELLEERLPLGKIKMAISTIPDFETNGLLVKVIREKNPAAVIVVTSNQIEDAMELYKLGADFVLTPHFLGGEYLAKMIREFKTDGKDYEKEKEKHIKILKGIEKQGKNSNHI